MGLLERIIQGAEFRTSGLANPQGWLVDGFGANRSTSGQRVSWRSALGVSSVFSAVTMISEAVGRMPLKVYRMIEADEREEARQHRAWMMLHDKPNSSTTANRFWSTVTAHLLLHGNAFCPLIRSDVTGLVEELALIDPTIVTVEWNSARMLKRFKITPSGSQEFYIEDEDMLHVVGWSLDGIVGQSRIQWCRNAIGNAQARDKFEGGFYNQGGFLGGIIQHPDELSPDAQRKLEDTFRARYSGVENAHKVPVLEENATFQNLSMPLSDMQFVENAQLSRTDIAVMFNLPPAYLGGSTGDSLTYATVESNQIQFVQHAVMPYTDTISKAVSSDVGIFPQQNTFYAEFVTEALLKADKTTQATYYEKLFALQDSEGKRVIGVDEIRSDLNMPPAVAEKTPEPPPVPQPDGQLQLDGTGNGKVNGVVPAPQ